MPSSARSRVDLIACAAWAALALLFVTLLTRVFDNVAFNTVRALTAAPLALLLPGYALVALVFPRHERTTLEPGTRIMFACATSIALSIICGVALHFTPFGIFPNSLALTLATLTLLLLGGAALRLETAERPFTIVLPLDAAADIHPRRQPLKAGIPQSMLLALALALGVAAIGYAFYKADEDQTPDVVQMWMLPLEGGLGARQQEAVRLGVRNISAQATDYRVTLSRSGYVLREWTHIPVGLGETWQVTATVRADWPGTGPINAELFNGDGSLTALRHTQYWPAQDTR